MNLINSFIGFISAFIFGQFLGDTGESRSIASVLCFLISLPLPILNLSYGIRLDLHADLLKFTLPSLTLFVIALMYPIGNLEIKWMLMYILFVNTILGYRTYWMIEKLKTDQNKTLE